MKPVIIVGGVLEIKAADGSKQRKFDIVAYDGGKLNLGNFDLPVVVDIATTDFSGDVPLLIDHQTDTDSTLGQVVSVEAGGGDIQIQGIITGESVKAKKVLEQADNKHRFHASIGVRDGQVREVGPGQTITANGKVQTGPLYLVSHGRLNEVSVVGLGGSNGTKVNLAAAAASMKGNAMSFEEWCASMGIDPATATEAGRALLEGAYKHAMGGEESPNVAAMADEKPVEEKPVTAAHGVHVGYKAEIDEAGRVFRQQLRSIAQEESDRVRRIEEMTEGHLDIRAAARKGGWSIQDTEIAVLRKEKEMKPSNTITQSGSIGDEVLEAALALAGRMPNIEASYGEQTLTKAHKQYGTGLSIQEFLETKAEQNGWHGKRASRDVEGCIRAAFGSQSLPGIFSNLANKFLLAGFTEIKEEWRKIARIRNVRDFKEVTSYRMVENFEFLPIGPGGEIKYGSVSEESFTNRARPFGLNYSITREDIINDDLDAMSSLPQGMGRGAAKALVKGFWKTFLQDHNTFFTTDRGNYFAGTDSPLSLESLGKAYSLFLKQKDPNGDPLDVTPSIILVPPALDVLATTLMVSAESRSNTTGKEYGTANPFRSKFEVVTSSYLDNSNIGNASTTGWYLAGAPTSYPMMEVCFLNGQQSPTITQVNADPNYTGIVMQGYFDFGVAKQDWRGIVKSKGAA
jgi:hypothetical protein